MTRFGWVMTTYGALLLVVASGLAHPRPRWLWNASASVPEGVLAPSLRTPSQPETGGPTMTQIGLFTRTADGYRGHLRTLCLDAPLVLVALSTDTPRGPDFRVHLGEGAEGPDVGAGWRRTGEKAGAYVALLLDDPLFARPIRANLFPVEPEGSTFRLVWSRPVRGPQPS